VQAAREAARRITCTNNLRNVALAVLTFHDAKDRYPNAIATTKTATGTEVVPNVTSTDARLYGNWAIDVLPFLEQQALFRRFTLTATTPLTHASNADAIATPLAVFRCPSDSFNAEPFTGRTGTVNWARGNYALNSAQFYPDIQFLQWYRGDTTPPTSSTFIERLAFNVGISVVDGADRSAKDLTDGTSNTILLAEIRTGLGGSDRRGVWAMGMCGSNFVCRHASNLINGVNDCAPGSDDVHGTTDIVPQIGEAKLMAECMMPDKVWSVSGQSVVRSVHHGGVFVSLADGSTRFISDFIDGGSVGSGAWLGETRAADIAQENFRVWQRLNAGADSFELALPQ
jgi:hypothetical protein